jgi:hypothetical protein
MHGVKMDLFYGTMAPGQNKAATQMMVSDTCVCCKTAMTVGPDGSVSTAWRHVYPDNIRDIAFMRKAPGADSFGSPVRVSEDNWHLEGCPDDGPAMVSDAKGGVHIVWPTLIPGAQERIGAFYAYTADGRTFTPRTELGNLGSARPTHIQMAIHSDGTFGVVWDESINGRLTVTGQ